MSPLHTLLLSGLLLVSGPSVMLAAGTGGSSALPAEASARDTDYETGFQAYERGDWPAVITAMEKVIASKPWHDDAHNYLGYAYRKQGDYEQALEHYQKALDLNPHHRGAMEYLGEAYLELKQPDKARELLDRLTQECQRIGQDECEELEDLQAAVAAYQP